MRSYLSALSKCFLVICLLLSIQLATAQSKFNDISYKIDSLASIGLPGSALKEVDKLDALARQTNNAPQQIRAVIYRMTFQSYMEENAMIAIIIRLKTDIDKAKFPVKPVLQSLLAETYWKYYQQNRYQFTQRSHLDKPDVDFTKWDLQTIITETSNLYKRSLTEATLEQNTPISVLDGVLEGDTLTRYLRPTLYDLLVQRALDFYLTDEAELTKPKLPFLLKDPELFGLSDPFTPPGLAFPFLRMTTKDTTSNFYSGIKLLQQASLFHLKRHDVEALVDLDLKRLYFLYSKAKLAKKDSLYLLALKELGSTHSDKPISSQALVMQGQYYQAIDSLKTAYRYFKSAASSYPESFGGKNALKLIAQLEGKELSAKLEDVNSPDKSLLAVLNYKNVSAAKINIYRLSAVQLTAYHKNYDTGNGQKERFEFLKKINPVATNVFEWVDPGDYSKHSAEIKIDALSAGNYVLMVKDLSSDDETLTGLSEFKVSSLAYNARLNPDGSTELRVMDRQSGYPLEGVHVKLSGRYWGYKDAAGTPRWIDFQERGLTNKDGFYHSQKHTNNISVELHYKGDTLTNESKYINGAADNNRDDEAKDKTVLFTDRQIYRPGQSIYFKGLQLEILNGKSKIVPAKVLNVTFWDVNRKEVSTLRLKTNEYGTISGSFIIPQNMLGGSVELETLDGSIYVKVEEYKRPTFQTEFLPVKESYKLNDSVSIKGTVTAFSGYGLSQARVAYRIVRSQNRVFHNNLERLGIYGYRYIQPEIAEIKADTITTDDQGKFELKFKAIPGEIDKTIIASYNYTISTDVTDAAGETHSAQMAVVIGYNDIAIQNFIPEIIFAKDTLKSVVRINNLNGQPQKGTVKVAVYALQTPENTVINRLWEKPDQYILSKADFKSSFPQYAYGTEDISATWAKTRQVTNLDIAIEEEKPGIIDLNVLKKSPSGVYQIIISGRNEKGDTTSITKYISLVAEPSQPSDIKNWIIPVITTVKGGESAEFLVGMGSKMNVLMERYQAAKLISSKWITIENDQKSIKIPISNVDKDVAIQFMMVNNNRSCSIYQKIAILAKDETLKLKLLTFRNKLQPGQKEQWKIQVSNQDNEKQAAEMLAGLYDSSLDDISPAQNWQQALSDPGEYEPNYFAWSTYNFVNVATTNAVSSNQGNYILLLRDYEKLNLFGYTYYGGYNVGYSNYLEVAKATFRNLENDKALEAAYLKNAALIKNGYVITGKVIDANDATVLPGVTVSISYSNIHTSTNSKGVFKIKVPVNAKLTFGFIGYISQVINTTKEENISVKLEGSSAKLNEVVVVGYGSQKKESLTGSVQTIRIRGNSTVSDNAVYNFASIDPSSINALAGKIAGLQISQDVPSDQDLRSTIPKPITLRTNFNETAFFYPQLSTDEKGQILIDFILPEALTKWKFRALAHTRELHTGYIEAEVVTQKQLSIGANMPRFLREGDTISISARLANLTAKKLGGKVRMQLFNGINMQPVALLQDPAQSEQSFELNASTNKALSFKLIIPAGLDALTYRITAESDTYSDGEENTVPVLPDRMLVIESLPMMIRAGQNRVFAFDKLLNNKSNTLKSKSLTLEYTQNPAWYAVQALPYMMEFPYECSEQLFSRYFANSLATNLMNKTPIIRQVFERWKSSTSTELLSHLEKNQELKTTLLEETPWLRDALTESEQKKRLTLLFDLNHMSSELQLNLNKLQKRQLPDGGFSWFAGDRSDRYITQHILAGIGQLVHLKIATDSNQIVKDIKEQGLNYLNNQLTDDDNRTKESKDYLTRGLDAMEIHAWYTHSYFGNEVTSNAVKRVFDNYIKRAEKQWVTQNVYEQCMIALTMQRHGKLVVASAIIKSLKETAQQSDDLGMYWAKVQRGYYWYQSPIETQSLLIELFTEVGNNAKAVGEMKIWLLLNKQTNNWKTTKATAAASYALLLNQSEWLSAGNTSVIKLDGKLLTELKPDTKTEAGTGYLKTSWVDEQIKPEFGKVTINNSGKSISWGAMHWQYLEQIDKITPSNTDIHLERNYFIQKQTDSGPLLTAVDASHQPKTGDLLKVVVYLKAGRDFEYVQLKDMRPAGTEPINALSEYRYQDGLYYYQVTKDAATNFFISRLNKGNYVFEYQLRVAQPGNFSTGITTVQCMYAPEFNGHSSGLRMDIKP
ncbi:alpha-2-macroglobulin family protein [Arcticibacter eurypsychrophilus]|uniref:alpha-2-macroglobulin family protein n=1 Tax=Arcticibacter eurypsychrophilus TaxID=1434752 RepID=UPI00084DC3AF|nr:alpha-2-macroglobulin family protein [Arcticibacter eurypsychrophilus]